MDISQTHIRSPFKFLDPYRREDGPIFFGRNEEVELLYEYVNKNRLVLVYGQSGTGKTSLVQCGLANRFEVTDWQPFFIRRGKDINASLRQALSQSRALGGKVITEDNLLEALDAISTRYMRPVYLIFDQFEELLILGQEQEEEKTQFIATIRQILKSEEAQAVNLLFILREEYFAWLDDFEQAIPLFTQRRLRVEPMRPARLEEVILESCDSFQITLEGGRAGARQIIENLRTKKQDPQAARGKGQVPLPYLQVYLDMLWREDFRRTYPNGWEGKGLPPLEFTGEEIEAFGIIDDVLDRFLEERTAAIQRSLADSFPGVDEDTVSQVLDDFTTDEGTKRPVAYNLEDGRIEVPDQAPAYLRQLSAPVRTACLNALEESRILRAGDDTYELAHDTLAALIEGKRSEERRRLYRLRRLVRSNYELNQPLTAGHLAEIGDETDKLLLEPAHRQFVEESRQLREEEQAAALKEERRRRRWANLIAVVGIVLASLAGWQWWVAGTAKNEAITAQEETIAALAQVEQAKDSIELQKNIALTAQRAAQDSAKVAQSQRLKSDSLAKETQRALANLQTATSRIVLDVLADAETDIYHLRYRQALSKYENARQTGLNAEARPIWIRGMMDRAYFYNEIGREDPLRRDTAFNLTRQLAREASVRSPADNEYGKVGAVLKQIDPAWYDSLRRRYYPVMLEVAGGIASGENFAGDTIETSQLAQTETTMWQYSLYCESSKEDSMKRIRPQVGWGLDGDNPVVFVNWYDAARYANWLSNRRGLDTVYQFVRQINEDDWEIEIQEEADGYRLPKESEWEYAARGGADQQDFRYSGSDELKEVGWYSGNSGNRTHPVARLAPTRRGELELYDMSGNVWEWCEDRRGRHRVIRGGSWVDYAFYAEVYHRRLPYPGHRRVYFGFRLSRSGRD